MRRRFAPHQLRHAHAVEMACEGVPLIVIQRQLGHTNQAVLATEPRLDLARTERGMVWLRPGHGRLAACGLRERFDQWCGVIGALGDRGLQPRVRITERQRSDIRWGSSAHGFRAE